VYTQPGTLVSRNWCDHQSGGSGGGGVLYPDEGSGFMNWTANVVTHVGKAVWVHIWTGSIHEQRFDGNYVDTKNALNKGVNCTVTNTTVFSSSSDAMPPAAVAIVAAAGANSTVAPQWPPTPSPPPPPPPAPGPPPSPPSPVPGPHPPAPPVPLTCPNASALNVSLARYVVSPGLIGIEPDVVRCRCLFVTSHLQSKRSACTRCVTHTRTRARTHAHTHTCLWATI
jgi:hypothetical protein